MAEIDLWIDPSAREMLRVCERWRSGAVVQNFCG